MQTHSGILSSVESHFRISQEDEAVLGVTLGCSPWAKKHVLAIEARESPNFKQHGDVRLGLRRDRRGSPQVLQVYFAAVWYSLDVAAPGDCSSAIKPKIEHRPILLPAIPFLIEPIGFWASTDVGFMRHGATHRVSLNLGTFSFSMLASWPQVSPVCPSALTRAS